MGRRVLPALCELLLLLLLTASHTVLAVSFPEDNTPLDVVDAHFSRQYPVFRGRPSGNESQHRLDFQLMTKIQDTLFIAGRDQVYLVSLRESYRNEIIPYRKLTWRSGPADREMCAVKGKHRDECHNFIKVLVPRNDDLVFICGTNGFNPMCRYYRLDNLEFDGEEISGLARCPFDSKQTNVALFADGKLYSATVADFQASDAVIYRSMGDGSALRTIKYDSKWLKEPHFLHAVEYGNYVYFFYREIAVEHNSLGKAVYSRVARICKNDVGGSQRVLEKHWTSFAKARLNCSVPGESFFYFDVLQSVTDIIHIDGVPSVVGVFTTQMNSIPGSAVCAFSMGDIEKVFQGRFKEQKTPDSVWTPFPEEKLPKPRPGCCAGQGPAESFKSSIEFPDETLQFIKSHPLMDTPVPSIRDEPWFTKTRVRYRLTALAVDTAAGPHQNYTVVFIGSEAGVVLKVLAKTTSASLNDSLLLEEIDVFNKAKCLSSHEDDKRVLSLHVDADTHSLYVAFSSCVIRIPLSRCERHTSCHKSCIALRDPYCGWKSHGACEKIQPGVLTGYEQDVEFGDTAQLGDCHAFLPSTSAPGYKSFGDPTSDMDFSSAPVTAGLPSGPILPPVLIPTQSPGSGPDPDAFGSGHVLQDDPATSHSLDSVPGGHEGIWDIQASEANQMVHMNILITCVFAAFLLGALLAGLVVFCYRDSVLHKPRRVRKDAEAVPPCSDSTGSFAKLNGLFDSPVKEYHPDMDSPKMYTNLLSNGKDLTSPRGDVKTMILCDGCQPPELAALPTPESTPVLQQKGLQPVKNQWERASAKVGGSRKESNPAAKSSQLLPSSPPPPPTANPHHPHPPLGHSHIPSAVVLPNATHEHPDDDRADGAPPCLSDKKAKNPEAKGSRKEQKRSVDARNTLNDLLKHLNEAGANPKGLLQEGSGPRPRPHLMLEPMEALTEVPPKVPSREASLYSPSSSLPRHSPTKRVDVPMPSSPTGSLSMGGTLERQARGYHLHRSASHRQSLSTSPNGVTMGVSMSRQHSMNRGGGYMPPTPPSRMDSHGGAMAAGMHSPHPPSLSRQSSYSGYGSLPRTGVKRTPSLKPDVPPKPNGFPPQTPQMRVVNKFSY
ncbi:sema domain, transmembrane domain (TM), and cytoplasmic domain, (semaphorin) 6D, like isoform X1 [Gadus macrocephalus]|uniref:sema domain, transmembrane domain (TM), and cytoplasmic domain, (semaphorin) 6D, like isoform X1 n=2 Tax=Gadus macrocephalus TaxID=80720 RepID=UPI0028CB9449|nr:sema domain, transmembrane domain (TM), and cytoplasmic domain, (semaphorin) 6D, like isoform X1 [Gadus macrocephalus]XP_059926699.1 sema domain, transmembrane domain (TM), and cytoplasmic domain, (semaphorin) 6D, like isoform X1 [Gadus macrocephalus]